MFLVMGMGLEPSTKEALVPLVGALYALPFILSSMAGGHLADKMSKRRVTIGVKLFELGVMVIAAIGLTWGSLALELTAVFLMGVHSAVFSPSKYGLLPELLPPERLSWGNGILELGTFVAIITGTTFGAVLSDQLRGDQHWSGVILVGLALFGLATTFGIDRVPAAAPDRRFDWNPLRSLWANLRLMRPDRPLWLANIGNVYFYFLAALLQLYVLFYGKELLKLDDTHNGYLQAATAIGIGVGSFAAGYLSAGKIEYGLVPLGAVGISVFSFFLSLPGLGFGAFAA